MIEESIHCRYCDIVLIRNYMCFLFMHPYNICTFSGQESKSHWGKDFISEFGTNDFLPDSVINELKQHKAQEIPQ